MNIKLQLPSLTSLRPRITVVGVGGAGSNAVNNMIASGLSGVNFVVANTDAQSLANSAAEHRVQLGATLTEGLGAGAKPEIGRASAEEAIEDIRARVAGSHMVFVAAGMGGGTGTGAAAVIARVARECGALTVGVVTKPFHFEGTRRMRAAEAGVAALKPEVDTLIVIPNQNLFRIANERTTFAEAFVLADQVLYSGIACVVDLIVKEGLINLDFADVRTIMSGMGTAMMGTGEATGERRAVLAAEEAISNPLLDDISLRGAKGLLVSITGSRDLKLYEVDEAAQRVRQEVDGEANIIVGATFDDTMGDRIRVSIVASGMERLGEAAAIWQPAAEPVQQQPPAIPDTQPPFIEPYPELQAHPPAAPLQTLQHPQGGAGQEQHYQHNQHFQHGNPTDGLPVAAPMHANPQQSPDFTRALSEALEPWPETPPAYAQPSHSPAVKESGGWVHGGAVFEDAPPQIGQTPEPLSSLTPYASQPREVPAPGSFYPHAPADTRRAQRRLPEVEDFPAVGQRDYHAKASAYGVQPSPSPAAKASAPPPEPPRKPGFFERLMGARRRSAGESPSAPTNPQAVPGGFTSRDQSVAGDRQGAASGSRRTPAKAGEDYDLPVFFGSDRK